MSSLVIVITIKNLKNRWLLEIQIEVKAQKKDPSIFSSMVKVYHDCNSIYNAKFKMVLTMPYYFIVLTLSAYPTQLGSNELKRRTFVSSAFCWNDVLYRCDFFLLRLTTNLCYCTLSLIRIDSCFYFQLIKVNFHIHIPPSNQYYTVRMRNNKFKCFLNLT